VKLLQLLEGIDILKISGEPGGDVSDICYDSRRCVKGSLFVAIPGLKFDGHDFISDATKKGAKYVIHERDISPEQGVVFIRVKDSRSALGKSGKNFFRNPTAELCLTGVTGTNGKTTVTYLLESILKAAGICVGVVGTINYRYNQRVFESVNTTPESVDLQRIFRSMADSGVTHVITEVSSHALDLRRVDDSEHDIGIFTNLSQDHLDYHHTMENYFLAKKRFFQGILKEGKIMIVNGDDHWGRKLVLDMKRPAITFGIENSCDISVNRFDISIHGIHANITTPDGNFPISSPLVGKFNLYNILAAAAAAVSLHVPKEFIQSGIKGLKRVPGRLERVSNGGEPLTFVDYAHTEDALKRVLENLSGFKEKRIITVFGCGGDRDRGKRPLMGKAATELSDLTIVTSDNPRTEDPLRIISEIKMGIKENLLRKYVPDELTGGFFEKGYVIMPDRGEAIGLAVSIADNSDIILIAGKGHEGCQIIGKTRIPFNDVTIAREALAKRRMREA